MALTGFFQCFLRHSLLQPSGLLTQYIKNKLEHIEYGALTITWPDGETNQFIGKHQDKGHHATVNIHSFRAFKRLFTSGLLGWDKAYLQGEWDSSDLTTFLAWCQDNEECLYANLESNWFARITAKLQHFNNRNNKAGSQKNIAYHYDLGNTFYQLWLDRSMTYSSAYFTNDKQTLSEAQHNKNIQIIDALKIRQEKPSVLEIGCGWGGFAETLLTSTDASIHGITLSKEQLEYAQQRLTEHSSRASITFTDYRDIDQQYDYIVSIEMLEAVGVQYWPTYFEKIKHSLKPGGKAIIQVITITDNKFEEYRDNVDFIQKYVFPGGMLPSDRVMRSEITEAGLSLDNVTTFGQSYAKTLKLWRENFHNNWDTIQALGFDDYFKRLWDYYLCYCEAGFLKETIDVAWYELSVPQKK